MWLLCGNSSSRSLENFHASPNTIIESLPIFPIPVQDSDSHREEIDIFPGPDDLIPPEIKRDDYDSKDDENSTVDEPILLHTPFLDEDECFNLGGDNDDIDAFLAIEVPMYIEEGYYDSDGDVLYLKSLLIDDTTHNLFSEVLFDHEPQCFKDESEFDTLKNMVKTFDHGIWEKTFSPEIARTNNDKVKYEWDAKTRNLIESKEHCTDILKIIRKRSKLNKHEHENGKSAQEPGTWYPMIERIQGQRLNRRGACEEDLEAYSPAINRRLLSLTKSIEE
ncbi:hypothetical protein Tco_0796576 [Tanacetum coccineum]